MNDLYDSDIALWAVEQAAALRARSANTLDWDHLAEEIDDVRRRYEDQIENRLITAVCPSVEVAVPTGDAQQ
jgi:hypothetical protein